MEVLPPSLSYSASKNAMRYNRFLCRPVGSDSANPGDTVRIHLPSKSLVNLSSFNLCYNATVSGILPDAGNGFTQAKLPYAHKMLSSVRVYVGGQLVSGGLSTHYDILHQCLVKSSASEDWCRSRYNEHAKELIENGDDINSFHQNVVGGGGQLEGATSKTARYVVNDFLGIFRGNGGKSILDTSLWGDVAIEFTFNSAACIAKRTGTTGPATVNATYSVANIEGYVECITQTTPLYIKLISLILDEKKDLIRFPYQNYITGTTNTGESARLQINSGCIDAMVLAPLLSTFNSVNAPVTAGDLSAQRYKFTAVQSANRALAATPTAAGTNIQIQIGSDTFPKIPILNSLDVSDITTNSLFSNSLYSQNLFFNGLTGANGAAVGTAFNAAGIQSNYSRQAFLSENFVYIQSFSDQEGWASKNLTGIDTASQNLDVICNFPISSTAGSALFVGALVTSMLVFDTRTGSVSVVQ